MAFVELETKQDTFEALVDYIISSAPPVPQPTLSFLGDARLISAMHWGKVAISSSPDDYTPSTGAIIVSVPVSIIHVSLAELRLDINSPRTSITCIALLEILIISGGINIDLVAVTPPDGVFTTLKPRVTINVFAISSTLGDFAKAVFLFNSSVVTLRFASHETDNIFSPPVNKILMSEGSSGKWLIRISGDSFVEQVAESVGSALSPPPNDIEIEESLIANWVQESGDWRVHATVGVKQINACPGIFSDVDVSVDVDILLLIMPDVAKKKLTLRLEVRANASDWDSFRCWAGGGLLLGVAIGAFINPALGFIAGVGTLIAVGTVIDNATGKAVDEFTAKDFTQVDSGDNYVAYEAVKDLPVLPRSLGLTTEMAADGLTVSGTIIAIAAVHDITVEPEDQILRGDWGGQYSCSLRGWQWELKMPPVTLRDKTQVIGQTLDNLPVLVFSTSVAEPAKSWSLDLPFTAAVDQKIAVKSHGNVSGQTPLIVIHSTVGVNTFGVASIPDHPTNISDSLLIALDKYCDSFVTIDMDVSKIKMGWAEPPPFYDFGIPALRQWQFLIDSVSTPGTVTFDRISTVDSTILERFRVDFENTSVGSLEVVTDAVSEFSLSHSSQDGTFKVRALQRWLIPTEIHRLPQAPTGLRRVGEDLAIDMAGQSARLSARTRRLSNIVRAAPGEAVMSVDPLNYDRTADSAFPKGMVANIASKDIRDGFVVAIYGRDLIVAKSYASVIDRKPSIQRGRDL